MLKSKMRFRVTLDKAQAVYYTGQSVTGLVHLDMDHELKVKAISVRLRGYADVFFAESQASGSGSNPRTHASHDTYLDVRTELYGKDQTQQDVTVLPPGTYKFPFNFVLPKYLPTSYETQIGQIRYLVHATVERPWAFDRHDKKYFSVIEILDLNRIPKMEAGTQTADKTTFCCLCCKSGPITASLSLKRRGYIPGETIVFDVKIHNKSSRTIKESRVCLIMQVLYHTSSRTTEFNHVLTRTKHGEIRAQEQEIWKHERLKIPAVPPSYLKYCDIIDVQYVVELKLVPKGPGQPLKIQREVVIGTVPLKSTTEKSSRPTSLESSPTVKSRNLPVINSSHMIFAESALGRVYNKHMLDKREASYEIDFVPFYGYLITNSHDTSLLFSASRSSTKYS